MAPLILELLLPAVGCIALGYGIAYIRYKWRREIVAELPQRATDDAAFAWEFKPDSVIELKQAEPPPPVVRLDLELSAGAGEYDPSSSPSISGERSFVLPRRIVRSGVAEETNVESSDGTTGRGVPDSGGLEHREATKVRAEGPNAYPERPVEQRCEIEDVDEDILAVLQARPEHRPRSSASNRLDDDLDEARDFLIRLRQRTGRSPAP